MRDGNLEKRSMPTVDPIEDVFVESSGNIFADLGLPDPDVHLAKAMLVSQLSKSIKRMKFTIAKAAVKLGLQAEELRNILKGRFRSYTLERLIRFHTQLGQPIEFAVCIRNDQTPKVHPNTSSAKRKRTARTRSHAVA